MNRPIASLQLSNRWPGSALSARQFTFMILALIGFSNTSWAQSPFAESCQITENSEGNSFTIQYDQTNIAVHGWRHLGLQENIDNGNKVFELIRMVNTGAPCDSIKPFLEQELKSKEELYVYSYDLYSRLKRTPVKPATVLALETSEEERAAADQNPHVFLKPSNIPRLAAVFDNLRGRCASLAPAADKYQLIVMLPTNVFWFDQRNTGKILKIKGVDDFALRQETAARIPVEARSYDPSKENYSLEASKAIRELHIKIHETSKAPSDKEIQDILKLIPNAESKRRTEIGLKGYQILYPLAHKRDVKFVENLLNLKADSVLAVGWAHLKGMKEEFTKRCKKVVTKKESIMAISNPIKPSTPGQTPPARAAATQ